MPLVKNVHDRCHVQPAVFIVGGVNVIAHGNKTDIIRREDIIGVLPDLDIVPSEPGQILYDYNVDPSVFRVLEQPLNAGS